MTPTPQKAHGQQDSLELNLDDIKKHLWESIESLPENWDFDVERGSGTAYKINVEEGSTGKLWAVCCTEEQAVKIRDALNQNRLLRYLSHVALPQVIEALEQERKNR